MPPPSIYNCLLRDKDAASDSFWAMMEKEQKTYYYGGCVYDAMGVTESDRMKMVDW